MITTVTFFMCCPFKTWTIMAFPNFLSFVYLNNIHSLTIPPSQSLFCSSSTYCLFLFILHVKIFKLSFFIMCPSNFNSLFLIQSKCFSHFFKNFLVAPMLRPLYSLYISVECISVSSSIVNIYEEISSIYCHTRLILYSSSVILSLFLTKSCFIVVIYIG